MINKLDSFESTKKYIADLYSDHLIEELENHKNYAKETISRLFDWHEGDELVKEITERVWRHQAFVELIKAKGG